MRSTRSIRAAAAVSAVACLSVSPGHAQAPRTGEGRVYVSVIDKSGQPLAGLPGEAFHVWENGTERRVIAAAPATDALSIDIILHGATPDGTQAQRRTLHALIDAVRQASPQARIALTTQVQTPLLADITAGAPALDDAIGHFVSSPSGLQLFEAIDAACKALRRESSLSRRVVFALSNGTKREASTWLHGQIDSDLRDADASLWVLEFTPDSANYSGTGSDLQSMNAEAERPIVISDSTIASGGLHDAVTGTTGLQEAATKMMRTLLSAYAVTYDRPRRATGGTLQVGVRSPEGSHILAPSWAPK